MNFCINSNRSYCTLLTAGSLESLHNKLSLVRDTFQVTFGKDTHASLPSNLLHSQLRSHSVLSFCLHETYTLGGSLSMSSVSSESQVRNWACFRQDWGRKWWPTPVFLSGESHGQRSLASYSPWGHKGSDRTEHSTAAAGRTVLGIAGVASHRLGAPIEPWAKDQRHQHS